MVWPPIIQKSSEFPDATAPFPSWRPVPPQSVTRRNPRPERRIKSKPSRDA
ncbi:hypothetical protein SynRCC2555_00028 [Synechococcus sp. WH 8101]|nr:hypothetical protein SynRCC2555_00028 [Synechococcus sp. WH 8101]